MGDSEESQRVVRDEVINRKSPGICVNNELDNQKRVSLSGSNITHIISRVSLVFGLFPLLALIEGIRLGEDLALFFRDVGPFILSFLLVSYVSYSCLLYTSPRPRDVKESRMPSSA